MGLNPKPIIMLGALLLVIYTMRFNDISPTKGLRGTFEAFSPLRILQGTRSSEGICAGISLDELFSESEQSRARGFISSIRGQRGGNPLEDLILEGNEIDGDAFKDYALPLLKFLVPWAVFFFVSLILCFGFCINWCCMFGICKGCKCFKCCKLPKEPKKQKIYMAISGVFLIGMIGASVAGVVFSTKISSGMQVTFCSALNMVENLVYGKPAEKWIGMNNAVDSLDRILDQYDQTIATLSDIATPSQDFEDRYDDATAAVTNFATTWKDQRVVHPDPTSSDTDYIPEYSANVGPPTQENTYSYFIQQELDIWKEMIETASSEINSALASINQDPQGIKDAFQSGIDVAEDVATSVNDVIDTLNDNGKTIMDIFKATGYAIMGVFIANLVLGVFALISMVMVGILKIKFFNKLLHLNWCIILLLTILCWLLSTFFLPSSVVMLEVCGVLDLSLTDETFFTDVLKQVFDSGDTQAQDIVFTCLHGDGNALTEMNVDGYIDSFKSIYDKLDEVNEYIDLAGTYSSANPPPSIVIPIQEDIVDNFKKGIFPDSTTTTEALVKLNSVVNTARLSCTTVRDTWVFNSINCTSALGVKFESSSAVTFDTPRATCVGFDTWGTKDISNRYTTDNYGSCTNPTRTNTIDFVEAFRVNRGKVAEFFDTNTGVGAALKVVLTEQQRFAAEAVGPLSGIQDLKQGLQDVEEALVGEETGLIVNTNCKFVGTDLRALSDSMCVGFVASVYQATIVMIVTSFMAFFSTIMIFCLAKKFSVKKDGEDKVIPRR